LDRNSLLVIGLSLLVWVVWWSFMAESPPPPSPVKPPAAQAPAPAPVDPFVPPEIPEFDLGESETSGAVASAAAGGEARPAGRTISFESPLYRVDVDTVGAGIRLWELKEFDSGPNHGNEPITLSPGRGRFENLLTMPFKKLGIGDLIWEEFEFEELGEGRFEFRFERDRLRVVKTYSFDPNSYLFELAVRVENNSDGIARTTFPLLWPAVLRPGQDFKEESLAVLHGGSVEAELLRSLGSGSLFGSAFKEKPFTASDIEWAGVRMTYFLGAMIPDDPARANARFVVLEEGASGLVELAFDPVEVPPGQVVERVFRIYAGPKEAERLEAAGGGLIQSIDLGWFWLAPLTRFFHWLLSALHTFVPNYGFAIILLTILVRVVTTPLTAKQMRSMERMRALSPKLQELKEKHGDDRQKQSEEMMKLYRQEGVNPLGGCFPMLLQLPVFIGLFYALRSSIQLRQAPFVGWINDLSAPETLFVIPGLDLPFRLLPLVMGATMLLQQKITPTQQMDPAQQRMMLIMMPLMMTFISYTFPSGLVLYWMVSNVLAIAHQLWIGRGLRAQAQPA